ncbi:carboxypeptidase regulatory-like domain-containing protein [Flavobacterium sp.]|uniref:carboxypeptidase regulatory-like domain-containing protein n=1 Tax=Flavobacterium sp. TaxID=239 RepID=UPI0040475FE8
MSIIKVSLHIIFFFFFFSACSQNKLIVGKVTDSLGLVLDNATIIASAVDDKNDFKFTTTNDNGEFSLQLKENTTYKIEVSYIGFLDYSKEIVPKEQATFLNIRLLPSIEQLDNIVISYKVEPMIIKKDTVVFDVSKFTNGNERKLKDQLQKLPGIEVNKKGVVTYHGKEVKTTLVESGSFFGGSSKIAVENIPADAVDKVVLLDNFSEVDFMKPVNEGSDLIMNVKLKKDKKKFVFGDVMIGHAYDKYYKLHTNLFYYSPQRNLSFIGDLNNNGSNALEFEDIFRIENKSFSTYSKNRTKSDNNLWQFAFNNDKFVKTNGKFAALNYNENISSKTKLETYFLYSYNNNLKSSNSFIQYANNNSITIEDRNIVNKQKINFALFNLKLNSKLNDNVNVKYSLYLKESNGKNYNNLETQSNSINTFFDIDNVNKDKALNHFFEYNRKKSIKAYETFVLNHSYREVTTDKSWLSNNVFLQNLFPIQNDVSYNLVKDACIKTNSFDATYSSYWVPNNKNIFTFSVLGELIFKDYVEIDRQFLSDGSFVDFDPNLFGNKVKNIDKKIAVDLNYKLILKKWTNNFGLEIENISREFNGLNYSENNSKINLNPSFKSEYKFNEAHVLQFSYSYSNRLTNLEKQAKGIIVGSFNNAFLGNNNLSFEKTHSFGLDYKRRNVFKKYYFNMVAMYSHKENPIRDGVAFLGIEQLIQPLYIDSPTHSLLYFGSFTKNISHFDLIFNTRINWSGYNQFINDLFSKVEVNNNTFGVKFKTNKVDWPLITIGYEKGYNTFKSSSNTEFQSNSFFAEIEIELHKSLVFKTDYDYTSNIVKENKNYFQIANLHLEYSRENNPWLFQFGISNLLNAKAINTNSISDYISTYSSVQVLPRIAMLTVSYKL